MMAFEKLEPAGEEGKAAYLFLQINNSHILDMFSKFRLQNSQRFSLKGLRNGFEVTEQGFFYNYYDNYAERCIRRSQSGTGICAPGVINI